MLNATICIQRMRYLTINHASAKAERRCAGRVRRSKSGDSLHLALAGFVARVHLVNDIHPPLAAHHAIGAMPLGERFE
jgi:hypothetical protein